MPKVKPGSAERWSRRAAAATPDYEAGIRNPRAPWAASAAAAEPTWAAGVQAAAQAKRFGAGVRRSGDQKWQDKALRLGAPRYGTGVAEAVGDYESGVAPYLAVIESTQLPPRGPKGDPRNLDRVRVITEALRRRKMASGG